MRIAGVWRAQAVAVPVHRLRQASVEPECGQGAAAAGQRKGVELSIIMRETLILATSWLYGVTEVGFRSSGKAEKSLD